MTAAVAVEVAQLLAIDATLEVALDLAMDLGEGPIWDDRTETLLFVDSNAGRIHRFDPADHSYSSFDVGVTIGVAIPRRGGGLIASSVEGLLAIGADGDSRLLVPIERDQPSNRLNDAKCDAGGRLFVGSFSTPIARGMGTLYRVDGALDVSTVHAGITVSNGLGWNRDNTVLYHIDTSARGIDCFDYDLASGTASRRRRFANIPRDDGYPDGLAVDAEDHVWVALYRGSEVRRYAPDGTLAGRIRLPVAGVTSCNFGGRDLRDLYITTARHGASDEELAVQTHAGALFRCRPGVAGLPSYPFAG